MNAIQHILKTIWAKFRGWRGTDDHEEPQIIIPPRTEIIVRKFPDRKQVELEAEELSGPQPSEFVKKAWEEAEVAVVETEEELVVEETLEVPEAPLLEPSEFVRRVWMADELDKILETPEGKGKKPRIRQVGIILTTEPKVVSKKPKPKKPRRAPDSSSKKTSAVKSSPKKSRT